MPDAGDPAVAADVAALRQRRGHRVLRATCSTGRRRPTSSASTRCGSPSTTSSTRATRCCPTSSMFGLHLATQTEQLRLGQMFNVVPQWHPLRLAEDFALADIITGGRMEFGVGRGTVPREAWALGTVVASGDNEMSAEHDRINREIFEESMEVIKLAWDNERFSYRGKHFVVPARRRARPRHARQRPDAHPQAAAPRRHLPAGHLAGDDRVRAAGRPQGRLLAAERRQPEAEVGPLRRDPRGDRLARSGRARTAAWCSTCTSGAPARRRCARAGPGHDEFVKFLSPYGRFTSYRGPDGSKVAVRLRAHASRSRSSRRSRSSARSTTSSTPSASGATCSTCEHICFFFDFPGLTREEMDEQMHLMVEEVFPRLGETVERRPLTGTPLMPMPPPARTTLADGSAPTSASRRADRRVAPRSAAPGEDVVELDGLRARPGVRRAARPPRQGVPRRARAATRPAT